MSVKVIFVLIDGLSDLPTDDHPLPLFDPRLKTLNKIALSGVSGLMDPVESSFACGSDTAHMSLFSYNPFTDFKGRGAFEVMGSGMQLNTGDLGFKSNMATVAGNTLKRRCDSIL